MIDESFFRTRSFFPDLGAFGGYGDPSSRRPVNALSTRHVKVFDFWSQAALIIVSGHRRVAASLKAGLTDIYGSFTDGDTRLQGFVENLQREGLTPIDEAEQMADLMTEYVYNQYQLADPLGKSQASVSRAITLNKLPVDIRDACRTNPSISKWPQHQPRLITLMGTDFKSVPTVNQIYKCRCRVPEILLHSSYSPSRRRPLITNKCSCL